MTQAVIVAGVAPAKAAVKLPPPAWFEEMRTPSAEVLLAEFRQHLDGAGDQADTDMPAACAPEAKPKVRSLLCSQKWVRWPLSMPDGFAGVPRCNLRCV